MSIQMHKFLNTSFFYHIAIFLISAQVEFEQKGIDHFRSTLVTDSSRKAVRLLLKLFSFSLTRLEFFAISCM